MKTNGSDPVSAQEIEEARIGGVTGLKDLFKVKKQGLTKREYFASMAMMGIQSSNFENDVQSFESVDIVASRAVKQADALIKVLNEVV